MYIVKEAIYKKKGRNVNKKGRDIWIKENKINNDKFRRIKRL